MNFNASKLEMKGKLVLILSSEDDVHAQCVAFEIRKQGGQPIIFDMAQYPTVWRLSSFIKQQKFNYIIEGKGFSINADDIKGVWWRRPKKPEVPLTVYEPHIRNFCQNESTAALFGWLSSIKKKVINPIDSEFTSHRKPFQLYIARKAGLRIPDTLISNSPEQARQFWELHDGEIIFKVLTGTKWTFPETRRLRVEQLEKLKNLMCSPIIFQELIPAVLDIRVTIVDDEIFATAISPKHPEAKLDWRLDQTYEIKPHKLPSSIEDRLFSLQNILGLRYGAIDMRLTPEGEYFFLEVNPGGQFLFTEIHAKQMISQSLAKALLK